jgi:hypothetical protein
MKIENLFLGMLVMLSALIFVFPAEINAQSRNVLYRITKFESLEGSGTSRRSIMGNDSILVFDQVTSADVAFFLTVNSIEAARDPFKNAVRVITLTNYNSIKGAYDKIEFNGNVLEGVAGFFNTTQNSVRLVLIIESSFLTLLELEATSL